MISAQFEDWCDRELAAVVSKGRPREHTDLYQRARKALEAIRLIELGARANLVRQLTGLEKKTVNRLYTQLLGRPSPPGQTPFTDAWYLKDDRRMLQASVVWRLFKHLAKSGRAAARTVIDVYQSYLTLVQTPLLNLTRSFFVSRLVAMKVWHERVCAGCESDYLAPVVSLSRTCPGCRLYQRFRCSGCGAAFETHGAGRRRLRCADCGAMTDDAS
jgi:hypothetical protein